MRPLVSAATGEDAGFAPDHCVAHVRDRRADQVDDRVGLRPITHRLGASPRLARSAPSEDEPDDPVAGRRRLVGARPEVPVMKQLRAFERGHRFDHTRARAEIEAQDIADALNPRCGDEGRTPPANARRFGSLRRFGVHSAAPQSEI